MTESKQDLKKIAEILKLAHNLPDVTVHVQSQKVDLSCAIKDPRCILAKVQRVLNGETVRVDHNEEYQLTTEILREIAVPTDQVIKGNDTTCEICHEKITPEEKNYKLHLM